jgi:hypothetical protein
MKIYRVLWSSSYSKRYESWGLLCHLLGLLPIPWLCMGDFNEIVNLSELKGSTTRA